MNREFCADLQKQIVDAITNGKRNFVFWGVNEDCITLLSTLSNLGILESYTSGVIDSNPQKQGRKIFQHEILAPDRIRDLDIDVLVVTSDAEKEETLKQFAELDGRIPDVILSGTAHFEFHDPIFDEILSSCLVKSYANGYENSLIHIYQSIKYLAANNITGNVVEFGIFKGGTIVFIAKTLKHFNFNNCKIFGFDIFDGFPSRKTIFDLYRDSKCEFFDCTEVEDYCRRHKINVVKGDICNTYRVLENESLMFSFFDTDNYSPSYAALETCFKQTVKGGILHFDHFVSQPQFVYTIGERIAAERVLCRENVFNLHGTGTFIKF